MTPEQKALGDAIRAHMDGEYPDESYDSDTGDVEYFDHSCSSFCAIDILKHLTDAGFNIEHRPATNR